MAVALVPPLACVGVLLARSQPDLAGGAALLFATNLFGIVLAASVVFLFTGFVPTDYFHSSRRRILATLGLTALPTLVVAAVLTNRFLGTVDHARELKLATQTTVGWLGHADDLNRVSLNGSTVKINITGKDEPPPVPTLTTKLSAALGHPTTVDLRWTPLRDNEPQAAPPALDKIDPIVGEWLAGQSLTLDGLTYNASGLVVTTSGENPPRDADQLTALLRKSFAGAPAVSLSWTHREPQVVSTAESDAAAARAAADAWIATQPGSTVLGVEQTDSTTTVTVAGPVKPATDGLLARLRTALPKQAITILWTPGNVLGQASPSTPSTPSQSVPPPH